MRRPLQLFAALCLLSSGTASAKDFYITVFEGDYDSVYAIEPGTIVDLGGGIKRVDLINVDLDSIEMEKGVKVTTGTLDVMVIEFDCNPAARRFKEDSEYVQFFRADKPIDKSSLNPSKEWAPLAAGSGLAIDADFICLWPQLDAKAGTVKVPAADLWDFVDSVVDTVDRIRAKK